MTFPVTIDHRGQKAKIYRPAKGFPFYRVAFRIAGKRRILTFSTYGEAKTEAEAKVKELHKGQQSAALTAKESDDALIIREALANYRQDTGRKLSAVEAVQSYITAAKMLPANSTLLEAIRSFRSSIAAVERKSLASAVAEFCEARKPKAVAKDGKPPALNPVYVANTARVLDEFSTTFTALDVCDLTKQQLDLFISARSKLSPKSRNHIRATLRMFLGWCVRRDFIAANHRLLEADDRVALRRMFELVFNAVAKLAPHFQVIITEHADLNESWYQDAVVEKWRGSTKLVPENWRQV